MKLADTQRAFQRHVMHSDKDIFSVVNETPAVPAETRLGIYSDAYRLRLRDALAANYPRLEELLGDEQFSAIAARYIDDHPSRFASIRWVGDHLSELLEHMHPEHPWLADLARWEWQIAAAFDEADASPLGPEALATVAPEEWPSLRFEFHPSLRRLQMRTNAPALFKALSDEQPVPEPMALESVQAWLVWREDLTTQYRSLSAADAAALDAMLGGASFEETCDVLCEWLAEDEVPVHAATLLKQCLFDKCVVGLLGRPSS